jgi:hypothetical protein
LKIEIDNYMEIEAIPILEAISRPTRCCGGKNTKRNYDGFLYWLVPPSRPQQPRPLLSAFSGNVVTENRARLKSDIASDLILLRDSWGVCADLLPTISEAIREAPKRNIGGAAAATKNCADIDSDSSEYY